LTGFEKSENNQIHGFRFKEKARNNKPETGNQIIIVIGQKRLYAKVSYCYLEKNGFGRVLQEGYL
jgi:hypothetical protein